MRAQPSFARGRLALFGILLCALACIVLTWQAEPAHALFTTDVQLSTAHTVKAFPTQLSVNADGYKARQNEVDRGQLTVTATYSDGSTRVLDGAEYDLTASDIPSGDKGLFASEASYSDTGHRVTASFDVNVDEAYGAQYGDTLVFGRGIPADTYDGKALTSTTWGIEEAGCNPRWDKGSLTAVVDIDRVSPASLSNWFNNAPTIRSVVLDQMDTSRVTSFWQLFSGNTGMVTCDVSKWDVSHVTNMQRMFSTCTSLRTLDLSAWNTSALTNVTLTFYKASSLTTTGNLAGWNMSRVTSLPNTFDLCTSLQSIGNVSGWKTSQMTEMMYTFANCYVLNVDCTKWDVSNVKDHSYFCYSAPYVKAPKSTW